MSTADRKDPLTTFLFGFKITTDPVGGLDLDTDAGTAFFKAISGIKNAADVEDLQEGGNNRFVRKVIKQTKWPNLVLKDGFTTDKKLWNWLNNPRRVDGMIFMMGPNMEVKAKWYFTRGYPVKWLGPDLDASKNELAIQTVEIAHEGLSLAPPAPPVQPEPPVPPTPPSPPINAMVNFDTNSSTVPSPNPALDAIATQMKSDPQKRVKVEGHTDSVGAASTNQTLSQNRANAVKDYLVGQGVPAGQITATGYGEDRPIASNDTPAGRSQNRRTQVLDA
jgi:phage tail-like protein